MDNNEKKYSENQIIPIVVITIIVTALVSIVITAFLYYTYLNSKGAIAESFDSSASVEDKLNVIRTELEKYYLNSDEIEDSELVDSALKGYVAGLGDEYTELMTAKEYEELEQELSEYVGIGIYVGQSLDGEAVILAPVGDESPAFKAGIKAYDVIVKVNGEDVTGLELEEVTNKIKGKEGTKVKITVDRDGEEKEFEVERKSIKVSEIKYEMIDNDIGYIDFDSFTETAHTEFANAYKELKKQGAKKLIIDLRDNTGGYVETAEAILDMFLNKGETEYITVDNKENEVTTTAKGNKVIDMPVVLLTNEYTASASEIMAGCLKDHGLVTIVGTKTYGKGVIQSVFPILDNSAYLKITTMKYMTPNKNEINKVGIEPDKVVELDEETLDDKLDNQMEEAIKILNEK